MLHVSKDISQIGLFHALQKPKETDDSSLKYFCEKEKMLLTPLFPRMFSTLLESLYWLFRRGLHGSVITCRIRDLKASGSRLTGSIGLFVGVFLGQTVPGHSQDLGPYSPTILKRILCLFLQDFVSLNETKLLIG